jgi:hypothetical protein
VQDIINGKAELDDLNYVQTDVEQASKIMNEMEEKGAY